MEQSLLHCRKYVKLLKEEIEQWYEHVVPDLKELEFRWNQKIQAHEKGNPTSTDRQTLYERKLEEHEVFMEPWIDHICECCQLWSNITEMDRENKLRYAFVIRRLWNPRENEQYDERNDPKIYKTFLELIGKGVKNGIDMIENYIGSQSNKQKNTNNVITTEWKHKYPATRLS